MPARTSKKRLKRPVAALPPAPLSDVERLKSLIRKMLDRIELLLTQEFPASEEESQKFQKQHDWMFGSKNSLVSSLVALTELMLRLEQASMPEAPSFDFPAYEPGRLNPADVALVEAFVQRAQATTTPAP